MEPHEFPRRVLVCVTGLSPQVVTETVYALAVDTDGRAPFVPTEICLLTTSEGADQARLDLLAPDRDQFGKLCRDYGLGGIRFNASCIQVIHDTDGRPLPDIRTPEENEAAADAITRCIAELTRDDDCALHVSLAGGRKTMGFFLGYALSLYGREQDRLSHVLVGPRFETHKQFFFKPRVPQTLHDRDGLAMSTETADIRLADIPFVPLRAGLHKPLLERAAGYVETVRSWRHTLYESELLIEPRRMRVSWKGVSVKLKPVQFAIYLWLALRRQQGIDEGWVDLHAFASEQDRVLQVDLCEQVRRHVGEGHRAFDAVEAYFLASQPSGRPRTPERNRKWLMPQKSRINHSIETELNATAVARIGVATDGARGGARYRLAAAPKYIIVEDRD